MLQWELSNEFVVIDFVARPEGTGGLRVLYTTIVSSFSSCVLSTLTPLLDPFRSSALGRGPASGTLLLELCLLGSRDGVDDGNPM